MKTAVYWHLDAMGQCIYIGMSANPGARFMQHNLLSSWVHDVCEIKVFWHECRQDALNAERAAILFHRPKHNKLMAKPSARDACPPSAGAKLLAQYLTRKSIGQSAFGRCVGVQQASVSRWVNGSKPSIQKAAQIEGATGGEVPVSAWLSVEATQ